MPVAFGDESFVTTSDIQFYVFAMVVVSESHLIEARQFALRSCIRPGMRFHFHAEGATRRRYLIDSLRYGPWDIRTLATPAETDRQERARRLLLRMHHTNDVGHEWVLESRGRRQDRHDIDLVEALNHQTGMTHPRVRHSSSEHEPLLWVADVFAGGVASSLAGRTDYGLDFELS